MDDRIEKMAFSVDEAGLRAGLGRDKIYAAIKSGQLEARKAGRRTLITTDALKQFIERLPSLQLPPAA